MYPEDSRMDGDQEMYVFSAQADEGQIVGLRLYGNTLQVGCVPYTPTCACRLNSTREAGVQFLAKPTKALEQGPNLQLLQVCSRL